MKVVDFSTAINPDRDKTIDKMIKDLRDLKKSKTNAIILLTIGELPVDTLDQVEYETYGNYYEIIGLLEIIKSRMINSEFGVVEDE